MLIFIYDNRTLEPSDLHVRALERTDPEQRTITLVREREESKHLSALFKYCWSKQVVVNVESELYAEMAYVDMAEVVKFRTELDEKERKIGCRNCGDIKHEKKYCPLPPQFKGTCKKCNEQDHKAANCAAFFCVKCKEIGHLEPDFKGPERRTCRQCKKVGHLQEQCPKFGWRKIKYSFPDVVQAHQRKPKDSTKDTTPKAAPILKKLSNLRRS